MMHLSEKFNKIKQKHVVGSIVKSVVCAVSLGLTVTGVLLLALKMSAITFAAGYYALVGVGTALVGFAIFFLLVFYPTDKQIAKRTDEDYGLDERVQTALAYSEVSGVLVELQREDAEQKIKSLPKRKFSFARIWQLCLVFVLSLAIGVAGIIVPAKEATGGEPVDDDNRPREVTELERVGVRELIANVEASSLAQGLKESVGAALTKLLADLDTVNTEGTLKRAVDAAVGATNAALSATLSYVLVADALTQAEQVYLGQAAANGGGIYRYYMLTEYDELRSFDSAKYDAANIKVAKAMTALRNDFALPKSEGLAAILGKTAAGITTALTEAGLSQDDALYVLFESFAQDLWQIKTKAEGAMDDAEIQNEISELNTKFIVNLTGNVSTQAYNAAVNVFVANRLKIIFGYSPLELPIDDPDKSGSGTDTPNPDDKDPSNPDVQPPGGGGSGETEYGSDDMVWVPGRGYMRYGDVIDEYYALINQYLHSDDLTDEQKNMIRAYYDILFGSNKNK